MTTKVYDSAHVLEQKIRESAEFNELRTMYEKLYADEEAKTLFNDFRNLQITLQEKQMSGQTITPEEVSRAQNMASVIQQNEKIAALLAAEQKLSAVFTEINKILMKPLEELYSEQMNSQPE